jgi:hypothetical protein
MNPILLATRCFAPEKNKKVNEISQKKKDEEEAKELFGESDNVPCNSDRNQRFEYRKGLWKKEVILDEVVASKRSLCFAGNVFSVYGSSLFLSPLKISISVSECSSCFCICSAHHR